MPAPSKENLKLTAGHADEFYQIPITEVFSAENIKDLADMFDIILTPASYQFEVDPFSIVKKNNQIIRYGLRPSKKTPVDWQAQAKLALKQLRLTFPKELLQEASKLLTEDKRKLLATFIVELNKNSA